MVRQALETCKDNQTAAARFLGLTRAKFRVLLNQTKKDEVASGYAPAIILNDGICDTL